MAIAVLIIFFYYFKTFSQGIEVVRKAIYIKAIGRINGITILSKSHNFILLCKIILLCNTYPKYSHFTIIFSCLRIFRQLTVKVPVLTLDVKAQVGSKEKNGNSKLLFIYYNYYDI